MNLYYVVSHEAYKTWTGTERANAQTEALVSERNQTIDQANSVKPSAFQGLSVSARVITVDNNQCVGYSSASNSGSKYIEIKAGGSRGLSKEVTLSQHLRFGNWPNIPGNMLIMNGKGYQGNRITLSGV